MEHRELHGLQHSLRYRGWARGKKSLFVHVFTVVKRESQPTVAPKVARDLPLLNAEASGGEPSGTMMMLIQLVSTSKESRGVNDLTDYPTGALHFDTVRGPEEELRV